MKATTKMTKWRSNVQLYNLFWFFALAPFITQFLNTHDSKTQKRVPQAEYVDLMSLSCKQGVNISISETGISYAVPAMFISPNYPNFIHVISRIDGRSDNKVTCADVGHTLTIIVQDTLTGDQCMSDFNVEDKLPPVMICDSVFVPCGIGLDDQELNEYAGFAVDNCTDPLDLNLINQNDTVLACPSPYSYKSTRTYVATDASGNSSSCTFSIYFIRPILDSIEFPKDTTMLCSEFSSDTSVTGIPTFMGYPLTTICGTWYWWDDTQFSMGCPGRYKIRRVWSVMDECAGETRRDTQYIMSIDTISPTITCPADITLSTNMTDCQANYVFPTPVAADNCTASNQITFVKKVDGIIYNGNSVNLALGDHTIEFIANDKCNNTASCTYTVTVEDNTAPNIICHDLVVGLNNLGQGILCVDSLDFEYNDNCDTSLTLSLRKMQDSTFSSCVTYDCSEYGSDNMLVVQVCDSHGNCNSCMVTVDVQDKQRPVIDCSDNHLTIKCDQVDNFNIWDHIPPMTDNCSITDTIVQTVDTIIVCNEGDLSWRIIAEDIAGNRDTCYFYVTVTNPYDFDDLVIDWPDDITLTGCAPNLNDTSLTGFPQILSPYCNYLWIGSSSDTTITSEGCGIVTKTWTIIDTCRYDGDDEGIITHDQIINADVGIGPVFTHVPADTIVEDNYYCEAIIQLDTAKALSCAVPVTIVNDYNDQGAAINDTFPPGVTVITFTATDTCGRTSTATTQITVNSQGLQIQCHDYTYACDEYNIDSIPLPELISSCGDTMLSRVVTEDLNLCHAGIVTVTYTVTDQMNHTATCTSTITVTNDGALDSTEIDWPDSPLTLQDCNASTHPDSINSRPIITNSTCGRDSIFWEDTLGIPSDTSACYAIARTWTIIDSCSLDSSNGGIWTFTQLINVRDTTSPVFQGYALGDTIEFYVDTLCQGFVDLSGLSVSDCSPVHVTNNSQAMDADTISVDASGTYKGIHPVKIDYVATDTCGNSSNFHLYVKGIDTIPPTWDCPRKVTLIMNLNGIDTMYAWQLHYDSLKAHDNCTLDDSIRYSFDSTDVNNDSILVICTESVDSLKWEGLTVYAFDESGNYTSCTIAVHYVAPEGEDVDCNHMMMISGNVKTEEGVPIDDVMVTVDGSNNRSRNDYRGDYYLHDIPPKSNARVTCDKHDSPQNGVSTLDIIKLRDHLLGRTALKSPYKLLAADVNNDQKLSAKDILDIRSLIVGDADIFPSGYEWRFVDKSYHFTSSGNPFNQPDAFSMKIDRVFKEVPKANFIGIKLGDLNNSAKVNLLDNPIEVRSEAALPLFLHSRHISDDIVEVTISADDLKKYTGMQFELQFDPEYLQFDHYTAGNLGNFDASNIGLKQIQSGRLIISWDNPEIETGNEIILLYFKPVMNKGLGVINLLNDQVRPEAYTTGGKIESILLDGTSIQINNNEAPKGILYQNVPNPFNGSTSIKFYVAEDTYGILQIMDMTGKIIYSHKANYLKGVNEVIISNQQLGKSGVYFYRFDSKLFSDTKKMILTQ